MLSAIRGRFVIDNGFLHSLGGSGADWLTLTDWTSSRTDWLQNSMVSGLSPVLWHHPAAKTAHATDTLANVIPFLHFGWLIIPTYGLMVALAMLASYFLLRADFDRRGIAADAEMFISIPCLAGIAGAKLYHLLETPADFFAHPFADLFSQFGFAWFGGLIAGFGVFLWLARRNEIPLLTMLDAGSPAAALGYGIGRIGCLLSGDGDYGIPTSLPWGMSFPNGLVPTTERVHPTPIYEFLAACAIAWFLWRLGSRQLASADSTQPDRSAPRGEVFASYLLLTGAARFLVEFIRINPRSFFGLTNAQAASLASIAAGAALWWWIRRKV